MASYRMRIAAAFASLALGASATGVSLTTVGGDDITGNTLVVTGVSVEESDPTVPAWAKAAEPPAADVDAQEITNVAEAVAGNVAASATNYTDAAVSSATNALRAKTDMAVYYPPSDWRTSDGFYYTFSAFNMGDEESPYWIYEIIGADGGLWNSYDYFPTEEAALAATHLTWEVYDPDTEESRNVEAWRDGPQFYPTGDRLATTTEVMRAVASAASKEWVNEQLGEYVQTNHTGDVNIGGGVSIYRPFVGMFPSRVRRGSLGIGWNNNVMAGESLAVGRNNTIITQAQFSVAFGSNLHATNASTFIWGESNYGTHGEGTFNIKPKGGAAGVWIGDTTLAAMLASVSADLAAATNAVMGSVLATNASGYVDKTVRGLYFTSEWDASPQNVKLWQPQMDWLEINFLGMGGYKFTLPSTSGIAPYEPWMVQYAPDLVMRWVDVTNEIAGIDYEARVGEVLTNRLGAVSIGYHAKASAGGFGAVAIGSNTTATANCAVAIGANSDATGTAGIAIGCDAGASGANGIAVGLGAAATAQKGIAIGQGAKAYASSAVQIGTGSNSAEETVNFYGVCVFSNGTLVVGGGGGGTPEEISVTDTVPYSKGLVNLTVTSGGTLACNTNGWANGAQVMVNATLPAAYTAASGVEPVGYSSMPTDGQYLLVFTRIWGKVYVSVITSEE